MTYNRSEIMKAAWDWIRNDKFKDHADRMWAFTRALKQAWHNAKMAVWRAQATVADRLRQAIRCLESKSRLNQADQEKLHKLYADLKCA